MDSTMQPMVVAYGFSKEESTTFILPGREITLEGVNILLLALLPFCNGYNSLERIIDLLKGQGLEEEDIRQLVDVLAGYKILVDARHFYEVFHQVSANPMPFWKDTSEKAIAQMLQGKGVLAPIPNHSLSIFESLLETRASTRDFSEEPLSESELERLVWVTYGKQARSAEFQQSTIGLGTVPSGGALYPLRPYLIVLQESGNFSRSIYASTSKGLSWVAPFDCETLKTAFLESSDPYRNAAAILVLACDFRQTAQKYSNRGYRYALLEAGHAAQNAYLWCAENGLGIVEIGGFNDEKLAQLLCIPYPEQAPLTTLVIGRRRRESSS